jgi:putative ABC transport system permease protein
VSAQGRFVGRALTQVRFDRARWVGTALTIMLSVAITATVVGLAATLTSAGEREIRAARNGAHVVVRGLTIAAEEGAPGETSVLRTTLGTDVLDRVAAVGGVDAAAGDVERFAQLVVDGELFVDEDVSAHVGRAWFDDADLAQFVLVDGRPPRGGGEIVIDRAMATASGVAPGDRVGVLYGTGIIDADVVGIATFGSADRQPGTATLLFDPEVIEEAVGQYDSVVARSGSRSEQELATVIGDELGDGVEVLAGSAATDEAVETFNTSQLLVRGILLGAAVLATVTGALVVASTITITIAQRRRDLALLRLVGGERRQVFGSVLTEVGLVSLASVGLGLLLSVLAARPTSAVLRQVGIDLSADAGAPSVPVLALSALVGVAASLAAAIRPALAAASTPPVESLRGAEVTPATTSRTRIVLAAAGAAAGTLLLVVASGIPATIGFLLLAVSAVVAAPRLVDAIGAAVAVPVARIDGTGVIGLRHARRDPARVARSAAGLWLGASLLIATAVLSASLTASLTDTARSAVAADVIGSSADDDVPTIAADTVARVLADERIASASAIRMTEAAAVLAPGGEVESIDIGAVDPATILTEYDLDIVEGDLLRLQSGAVAVHESVGLTIGDVLPVQFPSGTSSDLTVGAVFGQRFAGFGAPDFLVSLDLLNAEDGPGLFSEIFVSLADGVDPAAARGVVADLLGPSVGIVRDAADYGDPASQIGPARTLIDGLAWVAMVIAVIGLLSAIVLSVGSRRREISMFRAIGGTKLQVWWMVTAETLVAGLLAVVLSLSVGLGLSVVLVDLLAGDEPVPWTLPGTRIVTIVGALIVLACVVASVPARTVTRPSPLQGMSRP